MKAVMQLTAVVKTDAPSDVVNKFEAQQDAEHDELPDYVVVLAGEWVRNHDGSYTFHDQEDL